MVESEIPSVLAFAHWLNANLDAIWTFLLIAVRFTICVNMIPGIGQGATGKMVRMAGVLAMSIAATFSSPRASLPGDWADMVFMCFNEAALGFVLGLIPHFVIGAVQMAGSLSSTTMGLGMAQLVDPTFGTNISSVARVMGDLTILFFLYLGGHHWILFAASGMEGAIIPGQFILHAQTIDQIVDLSARIFLSGVMISAPVIVALLLTQFVMGLVTKAVPQVNIFIVSFPLTIGIGLILTGLSLPDILIYVEREFRLLEPALVTILGPSL